MVENKPEAPWIRRNVNGVIFTDNIQIFEDLNLETEERDKSKWNAIENIELKMFLTY